MADQNQRDDEQRGEQKRAGSTDAEKRLPWPEEGDPAGLRERFEHGPDAEQRAMEQNFVAANEASERVLEREFADTGASDRHKLANAFEDPNAMDDARIGRNFVETNSSAKKKKKVPVTERVRKPANRRPLYIGIAAFLVLFVLVLLIGGLPRLIRNHQIDKEAEHRKKAKPVIDVMRVTQAKEQAGLVLPGTTTPLNEAYIYARANGYLKDYKVDIGEHVHKGQLLADIDAPDLDAQVDQAREQVRQAVQQLENQKSQLALATVTVQRYRVLVRKGVLSRQQGDQQEATYASDEANVAAAQRNVEAYRANLARMIALQSYEQVRAPFDGVITQRNVDTGALIAAGGQTSGMQSAAAPQGQTSTAGGTSQAGETNSAGTSGNISTAATTAQSPGQGGPLFAIAQVYKLRILVSVPEGYAPFVRAGQHAQLSFQEYPGQMFDAVVARKSDEVDQNTRTMLTEVDVDNAKGALVAGMYVVVTFPPTPGMNSPLLVSGDSIIVRNDQTCVAVVRDGKVHIQPVTIGRDFGDVVEIASGLEAGDMVATDITDDIVEGVAVEPQLAKSKEQQQQPPQPETTKPGGSSRYSSNAIVDENLQGQQQTQNNKSRGAGKGEQNKNASSESKP